MKPDSTGGSGVGDGGAVLPGERRKVPRHRCEGKVVLRGSVSASCEDALCLYLRDEGPGGVSGTCFCSVPPQVNELYWSRRPSEGTVKLRVAWTRTTLAGIHMVGFQFVRAPLAI